MLETAILASLVSGAVTGLLARLAMTAVTLAGGFSNEFPRLTVTLTGTLTIVTLAMLFGLPFAVLIAAVWRWLPGAGWAKAVSAGVLTFIFPGLLNLTSSSFHLNNATRYVGLPLFVVLHFGHGFLVGVAIHYLNGRAPGPASDWWRRWKMVILPAVVVVLIIVYRWADAITFSPFR